MASCTALRHLSNQYHVLGPRQESCIKPQPHPPSIPSPLPPVKVQYTSMPMVARIDLLDSSKFETLSAWRLALVSACIRNTPNHQQVLLITVTVTPETRVSRCNYSRILQLNNVMLVGDVLLLIKVFVVNVTALFRRYYLHAGRSYHLTGRRWYEKAFTTQAVILRYYIQDNPHTQ